MSSSLSNACIVRSISQSPTTEILRLVRNPENSASMQTTETHNMQCINQTEYIKKRMTEYRTILKCWRSLRSAENLRHRTKRRAMKQKCAKYKQEAAEEKVSRKVFSNNCSVV